jgi:4-alpha-glucanotransferase
VPMASITFTLTYSSTFGEELFITGDIPELGKKEMERALPLEYTAEGWKITIETSSGIFNYSYFIKKGTEIIEKEAFLSHTFYSPDPEHKNIKIYDHLLNDSPIPKALLSSVFTKSIMASVDVSRKANKAKIPIIFNTVCPKVNRKYVLAISGSDSVIGKWTEDDVAEMNMGRYPKFSLTCDANKMFFPLEYKYVLLDKKNNTIVEWEKGPNRYLNPASSLNADIIIINDRMPEFDVPDFKGAGMSIPVFSLRSETGFGVGEFSDLKLAVDWAVKSGLKIIQTLPINDTTTFYTWKDSYPYNSISVFALHPMYLNLEQVGEIQDKEKYEALKKELNSCKFVDYESVNKYKWEFIKELYINEKEKVFKSKDYAYFLKENKNWLEPYAVFCFLRDKNKTTDFSQWGKDAVCQPLRIKQYCSKQFRDYDSVGIYFFVQYHLHRQLLDAAEYARSKGISLKGDIPIGVNRESVEVWQYPDLFDCTGRAGAPPDDFSKLGQNWGFPIYNWDEMEKDNYHWWTRRFSKMAQYFDAYRIDHILGFFRIFRISSDDVWALLGQFSPSLPLSVEEIQNFGIEFNEKEFCKPYIHEGYLDDLFGKYKETVKQKYLIPVGNERYELKEEVNNQKKIEKLLSEYDKAEDLIIKHGLMILVCQVLFVRDIKDKQKYHPRIAIQQSLAFRSLDSFTKEALNRLYVYFYYERHNAFWKKQALKKLPHLINATDMLVFGEDLGMIPHSVPEVMSQLEILSLEIQRMPKQMDVEFESLEHIPYQSVCTTSTHDMSTMRAWWEEDTAQTQRYFNNVLHEFGVAPIFCEPWICQQIIEKNLYSPAMWAIFPFQDWIAIDGNLRWKETLNERINNPANPDNHWKYRMHILLEDLIREDEYSALVKSLVRQAGR